MLLIVKKVIKHASQGAVGIIKGKRRRDPTRLGS